jgi:hypothetical protein
MNRKPFFKGIPAHWKKGKRDAAANGKNFCCLLCSDGEKIKSQFSTH